MRNTNLYLSFGTISLITFLAGCTQSRNASIESFEKSEDIAYVNDVKPILDNFCITCHSGDNPSGGFSLTNYTEVVTKTKEGNLLKRINDALNPMPQSGLLPKDQRKIIEKWAKQGFLEERTTTEKDTMETYEFTPPTIIPVDINKEGFDLLEKMQGHWVGKMKLMGQDLPWFAFDYRAISESHIHGIFEGGTMGNLFTSFFVTEFKGKRTIMARNGGILNGIYRTSYFVLDSVRYDNDESSFRLVDSYGGEQIMWMELTFKGNTLHFNSYTSRFGLQGLPKKHMQFEGNKMHMDLSEKAAKEVGFPKNSVALDFSQELPAPDWGDIGPITSASYIWEDKSLDLVALSKLAKDPYPLSAIPYVSELKIELQKSSSIEKDKVLLYLSHEPLTDENGNMYEKFGYIEEGRFNSVLLFPELIDSQNEFTFTYLHPGTYYLTAVADKDSNGYISSKDVSSASKKIVIAPGSSNSEKIVW